jgi:hypothetical protein
MTKILLTLVVVISPLYASPTLDDLYSMKTFNVGVINPVEEPIYAEHVDNEMLSLIRGQSRVEFNETAYINLRNKLQQTKLNKIGDPNPKTLQQITPLVQEQYGQGIRALILAEIITPTNSDDSYKISFMLFATG